MNVFLSQNPGIGGIDELTGAEEIFLSSLAGLTYANGDILYYNNGALQNLALGSAGQVLTVFSGLPAWRPSAGGGGGSGFQQPATGAVNGTNVTFTWATEPSALVIDGITKQKVQSDSTVNWTGTTTTILTIAPNFDIFAIG